MNAALASYSTRVERLLHANPLLWECLNPICMHDARMKHWRIMYRQDWSLRRSVLVTADKMGTTLSLEVVVTQGQGTSQGVPCQ